MIEAYEYSDYNQAMQKMKELEKEQEVQNSYLYN